jgi:2-polyprenyl-6-methoxyphenol hydroxylase-like FAD-dependent oxidoreductase
MAASKKNLRVIIVGGSIAGLTLAHSLQRCGIDFVVLEANDDIAPQVGASIGFFANGARVLDQLGVFDDVLEEIVPAKTVYYWSDAAKLIAKEGCRILEER